MFPSSSLLITSFFFTAQTLAIAIPNPFAFVSDPTVAEGYQQATSTTAGSGQYQTPATYGVASQSVGAITPTQPPTYAVTSAPVATGGAVSNWETIVTWPAGCESWANPCPPGAHISGESTVPAAGGASGSATYTNGFTSYTTMTNSNGVITGMPSVATVAAGVSTTFSTLANGSASTLAVPTGSGTTTSGFVVGSPTTSIKVQTATGRAVAKEPAFGKAAIVGAAAGAAMVALL